DATQHALPVAAELAILLAGKGIKARAAAAVITLRAWKVGALQGEIVVPLPAEQGRDQAAMGLPADANDAGADGAVVNRRLARHGHDPVAVARPVIPYLRDSRERGFIAV